MQSKEVSFYEWQRRFSSEKTCLNHLLRQRWPNGFVCPRCQFQRGYLIARRRVYECVSCRRQTSVTAGTVFHSTKLPLSKWFWALYWVSTDKGGISALRLQKLVGVSWPTAFSMLRKLRRSMGERDRGYRLMNELIELDDAFVGGKRSGKRGRGAAGRTGIMVACEVPDGSPRFAAMEVVGTLNQDKVRDFAQRRLTQGQEIHTDALYILGVLSESHHHVARKTPPSLVDKWLPWVHVLISNLKRFILGTYHGVGPRYLQEYLDEFMYRFNRRWWESQLPNRLISLCLQHSPIGLRATGS